MRNNVQTLENPVVGFQELDQGHLWLSLSLMLVSATLLYLNFIIKSFVLIQESNGRRKRGIEFLFYVTG